MNAGEFLIEELQQDLEEVAAGVHALLRFHGKLRFEGGHLEEQDVLERLTERSSSPQAHFLIARTPARAIIGFLDTELDEGTGELVAKHWLVDEHYRRNGVGEALLRYGMAIDESAQSTRIVLRSMSERSAAQGRRVAERLGFIPHTPDEMEMTLTDDA